MLDHCIKYYYLGSGEISCMENMYLLLIYIVITKDNLYLDILQRLHLITRVLMSRVRLSMR